MKCELCGDGEVVDEFGFADCDAAVCAACLADLKKRT